MNRASPRKAKAQADVTHKRLALPKLTPSRTVGLIACIVALTVTFAGDIRRAFQTRFNPRIAFAARAEEQRTKARNIEARSNQAPVFDGEMYRSEGRLREASAVAIAASLAFIARSTERRPVANVDDLLTEIARRNWLPPGVEFVANRRILASERSMIHVRLRMQPFGVEVVSLGRERRDGAALLLRVPDDVADDEPPNNPPHNQPHNQFRGGRYFRSLRLDEIRVPEPFVLPSRVQATGWQAETLHAEMPVGSLSGRKGTVICRRKFRLRRNATDEFHQSHSNLRCGTWATAPR